MVAICENMPLGSTPSNFFCRLGHSRCSAPKSQSTHDLHVVIYAEGDRLESCSRDPIEFGAGDMNIFRFVRGNPLRFNDPYGMKCTQAIFMGHSGEVVKHIFPKDWPLNEDDDLPLEPGECDRIGVICCGMDETLEECKKRYGEDHTVDWPRTDTPLLYCEDVPGIFKKIRKRIYDQRDADCKKCDCKEATIRVECSPDMEKCVKRLVKEKKIPTNPCGKKSAKDCKTGKITVTDI